MDRNNMRSSYVSSGPRSLPHMGSKRHPSYSHGGPHAAHAHSTHAHHTNTHAPHPGHRLSPPAPPVHNNNNHDELINYIYESWNKVTRELERGSDEAKYYSEVVAPRQLANFRPFNLEEWWARRLLQSLNRNKHRS